MDQIVSKMNSSAQVSALQQQPGQTLEHDKTVQSPGLRTEKFRHYDHSIEVLGSGASYHETDGNSDTGQITAHIAPISDLELNTAPTLTASQATAIAEKIEKGEKAVGDPALKILPGKKASPVVSKNPYLIYQVNLDSGKQVWIDAHQGTHLATLSNHHNSTEISEEVRTAKNEGIQVQWKLDQDTGDPVSCLISEISSDHETAPESLDLASCKDRVLNACQALGDDGTPLNLDASNCPKSLTTGGDADPSAIRAEANARRFLDYFLQVHHRNSYDDQGSAIVSVVHAGNKFGSALWYTDRQMVAYGDGDGQTFRDFTFALDVAGHELTHGVIHSTAGLLMIGETGALNESLADYFGKRIENQDDWTFGHTSGLRSDFPGIRDLKNPARLQGQFISSDGTVHTQPYPAIRTYEAPSVFPCTVDNDFCAVHFNATLLGHAWYGIDQRLGHAKAEKLIYLTLTHFLSELSNFDAAVLATQQACAQLLSATDCRQVQDVFTLAGLTASSS